VISLAIVRRIPGWPVTLTESGLLDAPVELRSPRLADLRRLPLIREQNAAWLRRWDPTSPEGEAPPTSPMARGLSAVRRSPVWPYISMARRRREARRRIAFGWSICYGGQFAGELTVWRITWGSNRSAQVGYWIDEKLAGRGIAPTALAMAVDHCFQVMGLHRIEAAIRPENTASCRVVKKLGFRDEGLRVREVHIDGAWRDHICYAITAEEVPGGMLGRWRRSVAARSGFERPDD
jgi:ribosomal-protein-alanine N-acetyltransferase